VSRWRWRGGIHAPLRLTRRHGAREQAATLARQQAATPSLLHLFGPDDAAAGQRRRQSSGVHAPLRLTRRAERRQARGNNLVLLTVVAVPCCPCVSCVSLSGAWTPPRVALLTLPRVALLTLPLVACRSCRSCRSWPLLLVPLVAPAARAARSCRGAPGGPTAVPGGPSAAAPAARGLPAWPATRGPGSLSPGYPWWLPCRAALCRVLVAHHGGRRQDMALSLALVGPRWLRPRRRRQGQQRRPRQGQQRRPRQGQQRRPRWDRDGGYGGDLDRSAMYVRRWCMYYTLPVGEGGGIRTHDQRIKSPLLYH